MDELPKKTACRSGMVAVIVAPHDEQRDRQPATRCIANGHHWHL